MYLEPLAVVLAQKAGRPVKMVMDRGDVFINTAGDCDLLPKVLDAAARFEQAPSDAQMDALLEAQTMTPIFGIPT